MIDLGQGAEKAPIGEARRPFIERYGTSGDDELALGGWGGRLHGRDGDDTLYAGTGADQLHGDGGADLFVLSASNRTRDKVLGFDKDEGDRIQLRDLFEDSVAVLSAPAEFIRLTGKGNSTTIAVDADGGGNQYEVVATVQDDLRTDLSRLMSDKILEVS